jgi:predicted flap endonuclease-1-like 5' DNA nuclease
MAEDMDRLRGEIDRGAEDRHARLSELGDSIGELRAQVAEELSGARRELAHLAQRERGERQEQIQELVSSVSRIREEAASLLNSFREARAEDASISEQERREFLERARQFRQTIEDDVSQLRETYRTQLADASKASGTARIESMDEIRESVERIRGEAASMLEDVRVDLEQARNSFRKQVAASEPATAEPTATPAATNADTTNIATNPAPDDAEVTSGSADEAPERPIVPEEPGREDDLTEIVGIGPSTTLVLRAAGIKSFVDIANASSEEMREALGELARFSNIEYWADQARRILQEEA